MTALYLLPAILSCIVLAAHFLRGGSIILILTAVLLPLLLLVRRPWAARVMQVVLLLATLEWMATLVSLMQERQAENRPWIRMAIIIGAVMVLAISGAAMFQSRRLKQRYGLIAAADQANRP